MLRTSLGLPTSIDFSVCPVHDSSVRTILARNSLNYQINYELKVKPPFFVHPDSGQLFPEDSVQIEVYFSPQLCNKYINYKIDVYINGVKESQSIDVCGVAENVKLELSHTKVMCEHSYISQQSKSVVRLRNDSDMRVMYNWKFPLDPEHNKHDPTILQPEYIEKPKLIPPVVESNVSLSKFDEDFEKTLGEVEPLASKNSLVTDESNTNILSRLRKDGEKDVIKYLQSEVEKEKTRIKTGANINNSSDSVSSSDSLLLASPFSIFPSEGEIWPRSECQFVITFSPPVAGYFEAVALCDVSGREVCVCVSVFVCYYWCLLLLLLSICL
jgi:hypothetical protein